jgi:ATP-binding protein involved in chromosome partitioning
MTAKDSCSTCADPHCSSPEKREGEQEEDFLRRQAVAARMCQIQHKILICSGKGGVGKSTVAVNLAVALAMAGKRVGLLDVDIHGPSIPRLLHLAGAPVSAEQGILRPIVWESGAEPLLVMSMGFLLENQNDAVIWRGPRKFAAIRQFLTDVEWGKLDYLIVDAPPGTGDEPLAVAQLLENADGAILVTTPQGLAVDDVRRSIAFCRAVKLPVLGVVENMSGLTCPKCGENIPLFGKEGGVSLATEMNVPFLGSIPLEPEIVLAGDDGKPIVQSHPHSKTAQAFGKLVRCLLDQNRPTPLKSLPEGASARIAIPISVGQLATHFGHCEQFVLFDVEQGSITNRQTLTPPPHEPGTFPRWLREQGATIVLAGGMGSRAQSLFEQQGIMVVVGVAGDHPDVVVRSFLLGQLEAGANICDH